MSKGNNMRSASKTAKSMFDALNEMVAPISAPPKKDQPIGREESPAERFKRMMADPAHAELMALCKKYGVGADLGEADETKVKDPTDLDWDSMFDDEPVSKGELTRPAASKAPAASGPMTTSDLKKGSRADTARAVSNIAPNAAAADMMSRINVPVDDHGVDEPENAVVPHEPITPDHVPATISRAIAMTDPHAINPTWHAVAHLPGNMSRAILTLGKALFRSFTRTPTEDIVMIGNVGGQGPNSTREVNSVANWVREHGHEVDDANIDFGQTIPGYSAHVKHYVANGIRFKIVRDQFGDYIYAWPETDSLDRAAEIGAAPQGRIGR